MTEDKTKKDLERTEEELEEETEDESAQIQDTPEEKTTQEDDEKSREVVEGEAESKKEEDIQVEEKKGDETEEIDHQKISVSKVAMTIIALAILVAAVLLFSGKAPVSDDTQVVSVLATVNGVEIPVERVDAQLQQVEEMYQLQGQVMTDEVRDQMRGETLEAVIGQELIAQEAAKLGLTASDEDVQAMYETDVLSFYESEEAVVATLSEAGVTKDQLLEDIRQQLTLRAFIDVNIDEDGIEITDEEARGVYDDTAARVGAETLPPFDDVIEEIKASMREEQVTQQLIALVNQLRSEADVQIN
jgi:hypothetical protein